MRNPADSASVVLCAALVLALAACGGGTAAPDEVPDGVEQRTIEHARGTTEVPADPQRIIVLEPVQLDTTVALGAVPVGTAVFSEATGVPPYLGAEAAEAVSVGTVTEPSLERIAALDPDLILGTESRHSEFYDQLAGLAPTVFMAQHTDPWQENAELISRAVGAEEQLPALLEGFEDRCTEVAETYATAGQTAQLIRPREDIFSLYGPTSFAGSTLECAGFTIPPRDFEGSISVDLSPELLLEARADHVFVTAADPADENALPPALEAVRAEFPRLYVVDQAFWISGVGPLGAMAVLDDIERVLSSSG